MNDRADGKTDIAGISSADFQTKWQSIDWSQAEQFLTTSRFRPMYDRAFSKQLKSLFNGQDFFKDPAKLRSDFLSEFDQWIHGSKLNQIAGLQKFSHRDATLGVTHFLDDLHIAHGEKLVVLEKEYAYHQRIRPYVTRRNLASLAPGDVLVMSAPFSWYGDAHPDCDKILDRCHQLQIPVHLDSAWYGCTRGFEFNYDHPAIQSIGFSLSKGLGLGSHRTGVRYSRVRAAGPVTVVNDFNMCVVDVLWTGLHFMQNFEIDYLQNRYGQAYAQVCEKLQLKPAKAIHIAFQKNASEEFHPVGVRAFLRYLVDEVDELGVHA